MKISELYKYREKYILSSPQYDYIYFGRLLADALLINMGNDFTVFIVHAHLAS